MSLSPYGTPPALPKVIYKQGDSETDASGFGGGDMAWRPHEYLIEGELDNTAPGRVTGWMRFAGVKEKVTFDLAGDFHRDIRGASIQLKGKPNKSEKEAKLYMRGFAIHQTGKAGDITAGRQPVDYVSYPYIEWYGDSNGRVVIELEPSDVKVIGKPIPANGCQPISRQEQDRNFQEFLTSMAGTLSRASTIERNGSEKPKRGRETPASLAIMHGRESKTTIRKEDKL